MTVKIKTIVESRFGKELQIGNNTVKIDKQGFAEVDTSIVAEILNNRFELVDKEVSFPSVEETAQIKAIQAEVDRANATARAIIVQAQAKAKQILEEAEKEVKEIKKGKAPADPVKAKFRKKLDAMTAEQLVDFLSKTDVPELEYKGFKTKEDLINLILVHGDSEK